MTFSNLDNRLAVDDLFAIADVGQFSKKIVRYGADTKNTPFKAGITGSIDSGTAIMSMGSSGNFGTIWCIPEGGLYTTPCICKKTGGEWGDWVSIPTNDSLNGVKIFNAISQIPSNSELTDLKSIVKAMPDNSILIGGTDFGGLSSAMLSDVNGKTPSTGLIEIVRFRIYRNTIRVSRCSQSFNGNNIVFETRYIAETDSIAPWSTFTMALM